MKAPFTLLLLLILCHSYAQKRELPVRVIDATTKSWVSGAPGGRHGIKYAIKVYINTDRKVEFRNVWIGKENMPFDVEFFSLDIPKKIQRGDTLLLSCNLVAGEKNEIADAKRLPLEYRGAALIEATVDGKARYFIVKKITRQPDFQGQ